MRLFLEHGQLPMHNNLSELMLRQAVVGRKNWLFAGSEGGAQAAAAIYTLVGSCMLQGIDPHKYLVTSLAPCSTTPSTRTVSSRPRLGAKDKVTRQRADSITVRRADTAQSWGEGDFLAFEPGHGGKVLVTVVLRAGLSPAEQASLVKQWVCRSASARS